MCSVIQYEEEMILCCVFNVIITSEDNLLVLTVHTMTNSFTVFFPNADITSAYLNMEHFRMTFKQSEQ